MKRWIKDERSSLKETLRRLGVASLYELMNSYLMIHISYGGKVRGGKSVIVRIQNAYPSKAQITFEFNSPPIVIDFDVTPGETPLGDVFEGCSDDATITLHTVSYSHDQRGWAACFEVNGEYGEIQSKRKEIDVQVITQDTTI